MINTGTLDPVIGMSQEVGTQYALRDVCDEDGEFDFPIADRYRKRLSPVTFDAGAIRRLQLSGVGSTGDLGCGGGYYREDGTPVD